MKKLIINYLNKINKLWMVKMTNKICSECGTEQDDAFISAKAINNGEILEDRLF